jgi:ribosomal protein S18 acetylase RimI-like enzyme
VVADTVHRRASTDGLRPLSLVRDWQQVLNLIEVAFGNALDAEARRALHSMRLPVLLAPLIGFLDSLSPPGEGVMPGFVWVEGGRIVGTAAVRRVHPFRNGWLISNVAVHPDMQGRGIGRALMEASVDLATYHGGEWVVLQVRDDNLAAKRLYESLGFQKVGGVVRLRKVALDKAVTLEGEAEERTAATRVIRRARWSEGTDLLRLARTLTPYDMLWTDALNRDLYQTGPWSRLAAHLHGGRRQWWMADRPSGLPRAAVGVEVDPRNPWHRLRLLILPEAQDQGLATDLVVFGLAQLTNDNPLPVEIEHPASDEATQAALAGTGFESIHALVHMRLNLK